MPNLLSDEEVFGASAQSGLLTDEQVFGKPATKSEPGIASQTAASLARQYGIGSGQLLSGIGQAMQAPGATAKSLGYGALAAVDRGVNWLTRKAGGEGTDDSPSLQDARQAAAEAIDQRRENVGANGVIARLGLGLQAVGDDAQREHGAMLREEAPEAVRQGDAIQKADGFLPTLKAMFTNPMGTAGTVAQSMPAMVVGAGVAGTAGKAVGAAARVAGAGDAAAARLALGAAENAGVVTEAGTSSMQNQQQVQDFVRAIPVEKLAQDSEQFREIMKTPGMSPERARDILAEQLGAQSALPAGLWTGAVNKATGAAAAIGKTAVTGRATGRELVGGIAKEAVEEGLQNPGENLAQYGAQVEADPSQKFDLGGSIAQGLVSGAAMAAPLHGSGFVQQKVDDMRAARAAVPQNAPAVTDPAAVVPPDTAAVTPAAPAVAPTDAEKALFEPRSATSLDRVQEIDGELPRLQSRLAELNRPDAGYGPAFDAERQEVSSQAQALEQERDAITKDWPKTVGGGETSFTTEAGARVNAQYALVDAADLVTSHDEHLRQNPAYPQELQPRARDRAASEMQVSGIVQRLDPARLGASADAANGAPIIGADGLVESGNARSIALKRIYRVTGEKAEAYKAWLRENAEAFGLHPADVDLLQKPVLVRVRQTPVDRAEFARQANASTVAAMSPSEQAKADASRIDSMEDLQPDEHGDFSGAGSRDFVRRFMARLPATEQAGMVDSSGRLSSAGYARVRNAVLARAYGDSPVLARMTESLDDNLRNISRALIASAPRVAQMRDAIAAGARHDADLTPHLLSAVEELSKLKDTGRSVHDELAQAGLLGEKFSPETAELMRFLADNIRRPRRIADFIAATVEALDAAGDPKQASMFGDNTAPSAADLIQAARRAIDEQGTAPDAERRNPDEGSGPGPATGSQPEAAPVGAQRDQGNGPAGSSASQQRVSGETWARFPDELGSLNIPRADMPQLRGDARGALVNFLEARGITHETGMVPAAELKPAQAEFSPDKVRNWEKVRDGTDRSVLAASDGRILDGHHQWMDALTRGAEVKAIRFSVPFDELRAAVAQFPSTEVSNDSLPKLTPEQASKLAEMRAQAEAEKPAFDATLREIAAAVGGDVRLAKIKGIGRASEKIIADYDGDVSRIKDLLRGTVVVPSPADAASAIAALEARFDVLPGGRRNLLDPAVPALPSGYRDAKLNVRLPGGGVAEVQVNTPEMLKAKSEMHALYEAKQKQERATGQKSGEDLDARMRDVYEAAWADSLAKRESQSSADSGAPSEYAVRGVKGRGTSLSKAVPSERSVENIDARGDSATGMSDTSQNDVPAGNVDEAGTLGRTAETGSRFMRTSAPILSAAEAKRVADVRVFAESVASKWAAKPDIVVVQNMQDEAVPKEVRDMDAEQKSQGASGEPDGFFHKGTVYLVASQLQGQADAQRVLFHEALGHYGLRGLYGDSLRPILTQLVQARPDLVKPKAAAYGLDFADKNQRLMAAEEVLAEMAQSRPELGFVTRTVAAVRSWLRANVPGFAGLKLTDAEIIRSYILPARGWVERGQRAAADGAMPALSRRTVDTSKSVAERADEIINDAVKTRAPVDAAFRFAVNNVAHLPQLIEAGIRGSQRALDAVLAKLPQPVQEKLSAGAERVRAGIVSDYGVPEAVIDQRALLQGRQRVQLRQAGKLIDQLATLTRAESRVAYEWMNEKGDTEHAAELMKQLPAESVKVLKDVQAMIDRLSQDAVHLGQLSAEAFERNRFAYLRRSYAKHVIEQQEGGEKKSAARARALSVLGDQYKGRGIVEAATMKQMQALAPEWWKRKLQAGKADTSLKGEQFVRLERHEASGEGTTPMEGIGDRTRGKLREVAYYPAGEPLPAKYADWDQAGTFEVRDVQGDEVVLWRDFTKAEREQMGEVDEARFAIAKTLQGMIHDVEVGRYLEWLAQKYAIKNEAAVPGPLVEAGESWRHTFKPGEWVKVPDSKIPGTAVAKYGKLAGRYLPGPIWNDLRQTAGGQFKPFGETFGKVLSAWKTAKTALSPAVHTNNIMSNFVMADWHDVSAAHTAKALRILLAAHDLGGEGVLGRAGNAAAKTVGIVDRAAAEAIVTRYKDSGGDIGSWATQEIAQNQLEPLLAAIEAEAQAGDGNSAEAQLAAASAIQLAMAGRLKDAAAAAARGAGKAAVTEAKTIIELYQSEDEVFRLAQWLKAKEGGASDLEAGKLARTSFMDYAINAPWIQAMRATAFPFIAYTYRAAPMLLQTARTKPHKLLKLMTLAALANYLGVMIAGGGDDKERKLLPEEKAGGVWGLVPKLIRMPWNDAHGSPVYLDIRRFIPVGDVVDLGAGHSAVPLPPALQPGGPLALLGEIAFNESSFTGKPITLETDTPAEKVGKLLDHVYKFATPNLLGVPNTYATQGVVDASKGRTDAFGREQSVTQAVVSSVGIKLGSYPADVLRRQLYGKLAAETMEIDKNIAQLRRQRQTNQITPEEFTDKLQYQQGKKRKLTEELQRKVGG